MLVDGIYHIFNLTTPPSTESYPERQRVSWARIRSTNLIEWTRDAEPIVGPGESDQDPDADGAWTGSAVLDLDGNMNLFYTGYNISQNGRHTILRTRASDRHGHKFEKPARPVIIIGARSRFEDVDFRCPFVFYNNAEARFWMLVGSRLKTGPYWRRGCIVLLTSPDLETWTVAPEPLYAPNDVFFPESPELFTLPNGKWYLVYSRFQAPNAGTVYRVADTPRGPFRVPRDGSHGRLDGRRWHAARSCPKAGDSHKRMSFGWVGDFADDENKWLWGGDLGVAREMWADNDACLRVGVSHELRTYLWRISRPVSTSNAAPSLYLCSPGSTATHFPELGPAEWRRDLTIEFNVAACDAHSFGIMLQMDSTGKGFRLQFTPTGSGLFSVILLIETPPLDDSWADQYQTYLDGSLDGPELIRHDNVSLTDGIFIFLRGQLMETFCGGRSLSFRLPTLPSWDDDQSESVRRFGWFVEDGMVDVVNISMRHSLTPKDWREMTRDEQENLE